MLSKNPAAKPSARLHAKYLVLMRRIDAYIDANLASPLYNDVCAAELGMSPRSLSNVVQQIHAMSVQRYIRARRLSAVRDVIRTQGQACQIGVVAKSHGFQHLGEFSQGYKSQFGELPSATAQRLSVPPCEEEPDDAINLQPTG